jgi:hypothetical protein
MLSYRPGGRSRASSRGAQAVQPSRGTYRQSAIAEHRKSKAVAPPDLGTAFDWLDQLPILTRALQLNAVGITLCLTVVSI